jgi:uncharacterized protein (DUF58 family)
MTETGRGILIGTIFVFLACLVIPAFGILAALAVLQSVALGFGWWFRPRLRLHGSWPEQAIAGQMIRARFTLTNTSRYPAYQLWLEPLNWPAEFEPCQEVWPLTSLAPGESHTVTLSALCRQRGCYPLGSPTYSSSFPFNLYRFGARSTRLQQVLILPAFQQLERSILASMGSAGGRLGQAQQWIGASPEYIGSRPFHPGDSPRRIDARAWARLAVPAVKEFFDESRQATALVLDTCTGTSGKPISAQQRRDFEGAVSLAASLAHSLPQHATLNTLVVGSDVHALTGENLSLQVDQAHRELATVALDDHLSKDDPGVLAESLFHIQELLIVGIAWHERTLRLAEWAQQHGCHITMIRVGADASDRESSPVSGVQIHCVSHNAFSRLGEVLPW